MKKPKSKKRLAGIGAALVVVGGLWWWRANAEPVLHIPPVKIPVPNAYDFYSKADKAHAALITATPGIAAVDSATDGRFDPSWTPQQLAVKYPTAAKVAWVKKCAPVLHLVRQAMRHEYQYPYPNDREPFIVYRTAHYRTLARLLLIESRACAESGDLPRACQSALDIMRMGHQVQHGMPTYGGLIGFSMNSIGRAELQKMVPRLDARTARDTIAQLQKLEARRVSYAAMLTEEKYIGQLEMQQLMATRGWRISFAGLKGVKGSWPEALRILGTSKRRAMKEHDAYMDAVIAQARLSYVAAMQTRLPQEPINQIIGPIYDRTRWNVARHETHNRALMLQLALHAWKLERGSLPTALSDLTPQYLKAVPLDPYGGGEAFRYRRMGASYILYSVGPDSKDNGGKPITRVVKRGSKMSKFYTEPNSTGDFVVGVNR